MKGPEIRMKHIEIAQLITFLDSSILTNVRHFCILYVLKLHIAHESFYKNRLKFEHFNSNK